MEFRDQCLRHVREEGGSGRPPSLSAPALLRLPLVLGGALILVVLFSFLISSNDVASGRLVVRVPGTSYARASRDALVGRVLVHPGEAVREGDPLVELDDPALGQVFELAKRARDEAMVAVLRSPRDLAARGRLRDLNQALALRRYERASLVLRSPRDGTVASVRGEANALVAKGDILASLHGDVTGIGAQAYFPGFLASRVRAGDRLRVRFQDGRREIVWFEVVEVGLEALSPSAPARRSRVMGAGTSREGAVVAIKARPLHRGAVGKTLVDGLVGQAELVVRERSLSRRIAEGLGWSRSGGEG